MRNALGRPVIAVGRAAGGPRWQEKLQVRLVARGYLPIWTVFRPTTTDYPGSWGVRVHVVRGGPSLKTRWVGLGASLEEVRALIPPGLMLVPRDPSDSAVIEESWI